MMGQKLKKTGNNIMTATVLVGSIFAPAYAAKPLKSHAPAYDYTEDLGFNHSIEKGYRKATNVKDKAADRAGEIVTKLITQSLNLLPVLDNSIQWTQFSRVIWELARIYAKGIDDLNIALSAENELSIYRHTSDGIHFLVVGDEQDDVSYVFTSNTPGKYYTMHLGAGNNLRSIVKKFASA